MRILPIVTTLHAVSKSSMSSTCSTTPASAANASPIIIPLTYLEFYAGVGGWTMALKEAVRAYSQRHARSCDDDEESSSFVPITTADALFSLHRVAALDHSDLCLDVYHHQNYGRTVVNDGESSTTSSSTTFSNKACRIEHLQGEQIRAWQNKAASTLPQRRRDMMMNATTTTTTTDIWMMSPPCQPHTRQHDNQATDVQDPRSQSFLHLCQLLRDNCNNNKNHGRNCNDIHDCDNNDNSFSIPKLIFLENVIGFEQSESCQTWRRVLHECGYRLGHFHLTPTQVGLPNDRPRYFCMAVQENAIPNNNNNNNGNNNGDESLAHRYLNDIAHKQQEEQQQQLLQIHTSIPELNVRPVVVVETAHILDDDSSLPCIRDFLDDSSSNSSSKNSSNHSQSSLQVPRKILERNASWCFDIVHADSRRSACFTSSYGKYVKGTGSILYEGSTISTNNNNSNSNELSGTFSFDLVHPQEREFDEDWMESLDTTMLRYFSGSEMARLFGFPSEFAFPHDISMKQQWKLMGNSLNVRLAARLIELGLLLIHNNDRHQGNQKQDHE